MLASLLPCAAEVLTTDGNREVVVLDGGFISVADNRVSLLSPFARIAAEIDLKAAEHELAAAEKRLNAGEIDDETRHHFMRAQAQVKAARLTQGR
jgi:F-type H+-transporting ATPase subunit epsilon